MEILQQLTAANWRLQEYEVRAWRLSRILCDYNLLVIVLMSILFPRSLCLAQFKFLLLQLHYSAGTHKTNPEFGLIIVAYWS